MQRGAGANAPLSRQLQAIDEEYKYLLDQGQSGKADYVQSLYIWKSKQATQVNTSNFSRNLVLGKDMLHMAAQYNNPIAN